jgi:hypothetical protein
MPDCGVHGGTYDEAQYNVTKLVDATGALTLRQRLEAFIAASASGMTSEMGTATRSRIATGEASLWLTGFRSW